MVHSVLPYSGPQLWLLPIVCDCWDLFSQSNMYSLLSYGHPLNPMCCLLTPDYLWIDLACPDVTMNDVSYCTGDISDWSMCGL